MANRCFGCVYWQGVSRFTPDSNWKKCDWISRFTRNLAILLPWKEAAGEEVIGMGGGWEEVGHSHNRHIIVHRDFCCEQFKQLPEPPQVEVPTSGLAISDDKVGAQSPTKPPVYVSVPSPHGNVCTKDMENYLLLPFCEEAENAHSTRDCLLHLCWDQ